MLGCGTQVGGTDSPPPPPYDGVTVICQNFDDGDWNYWWPGVDGENETCTIEGKLFDPCPDQFGDHMQLCIGPMNPDGTANGDFDLDDWSASLAAMDMAIRSRCSTECTKKTTFPDQWPDPHCVDADWDELQGALNWEPEDGFNCYVAYERNGADPDGSAVQWPPAGASEPVPCDLDYSCCDEFAADICQFIETPTVGLIAADTRRADYKAETDSGTELAFDMPGTGSGVDDTHQLIGFAEYSPSACGADACPFYLANLSAFNTTDTWDVSLQVMGGAGPIYVAKKLQNVHVDLMQSVLGMWLPSTGDVVFPQASLLLRVEFEIDSCSTCNSTGDGHYVLFIENDADLPGEFTSGALELAHSFQMQGGTAALSVVLSPEEYPPTAVIDLPASTVCNTSTGFTLPAGADDSTDPDSDIAYTHWFLDGAPISVGSVIPAGGHTIELIASDSRSAVSRDSQSFTVTRGSTCP